MRCFSSAVNNLLLSQSLQSPMVRISPNRECLQSLAPTLTSALPSRWLTPLRPKAALFQDSAHIFLPCVSVILIIVTLSNWSSEEGGNFVNDLASNESLDRLGQEHALAGFIVKNPAQRGDVPRTTLASTIEAIIGRFGWILVKTLGRPSWQLKLLNSYDTITCARIVNSERHTTKGASHANVDRGWKRQDFSISSSESCNVNNNTGLPHMQI